MTNKQIISPLGEIGQTEVGGIYLSIEQQIKEGADAAAPELLEYFLEVVGSATPLVDTWPCSYATYLEDYIRARRRIESDRRRNKTAFITSRYVDTLREKLYSAPCKTCKVCLKREKSWPDEREFKYEDGPTFSGAKGWYGKNTHGKDIVSMDGLHLNRNPKVARELLKHLTMEQRDQMWESLLYSNKMKNLFNLLEEYK